jgi:hypothetical protein
VSANRYIRFVELSSGLIRDSRIPLFSSKFSKKTYTQHQLLILLLLKEYLSEDYRDTVELTEIMDSLREKIHFDEVPHFTTIQKFCQRIRSSTFSRQLNRLIKQFYDRGASMVRPGAWITISQTHSRLRWQRETSPLTRAAASATSIAFFGIGPRLMPRTSGFSHAPDRVQHRPVPQLGAV